MSDYHATGGVNAIDLTARADAATADAKAVTADGKAVVADAKAVIADQKAVTAQNTATALSVNVGETQADVEALTSVVNGLSVGGGNTIFFIDALAVSGTIAVGTGVIPTGIRIMANDVIAEFTPRVGTAPTGGPLTVQLTKNGVAIGTAVSIPAGSKTATASFTPVPVARGDILNLNVTAVGTTVAGSHLAFTVADTVVAYQITSAPGLYSYYDMSLQGGVDGQQLTGLDDTFSTRNLTAAGATSPVWDTDVFGTGKPGVVATSDPGYYVDPSPFKGASTFTLVLPIKLLANNTDGFLFSTPFQHQVQMFGNDRFTWRLSSNGTSWGTVIDAPNLTVNATKLLIFRVGAGRAQLEVNGVVTNDVAFTAPVGNTTGRWSLGSNLDGGGSVQNIAIGTPVISLSYLTGDDLAALRTKVGALHGLTL